MSADWRKLVESGVEALGFELVDAQFAGSGRQAVLRVYIDLPGGVTVEDCAEVSEQLSAILDVEDPIPQRYTLEVSSPGLDRPLVRRRDFERFTGEMVRVRLREPVAGQRNFKGRLIGVRGDCVTLSVDERTVDVRLDDIERARLVPKL
jgi:ribosome maturation factor RimP